MIELYLTLASHHFDNSYDYNEANPGIMLQHEGFVFGGYKNSFHDMSYLAAKKYDWQKGGFEYGFLVGAVTGYDMNWTVEGVTAFAAPYVSYDFDVVKPTVLVLGNAVTLSVGFSF